MTRLALVLALAGCGPSAPHKPTGTPTDPVEKCERAVDVCKYDGSQLGVCGKAMSGSGFACVPQH
jgi:hypothetical protein